MVIASPFEGDTERFAGSSPAGITKSSWNYCIYYYICGKLTCGVIGNTSDFGSEVSEFESQQVNNFSL